VIVSDVGEKCVDCGEYVDCNDPVVRVQARSWEVQEGHSDLFWARVMACTKVRCNGMVDGGVWNVVGDEVQRRR
jgi:hypothetical protein